MYSFKIISFIFDSEKLKRALVDGVYILDVVVYIQQHSKTRSKSRVFSRFFYFFIENGIKFKGSRGIKVFDVLGSVRVLCMYMP